MRISIKEGKRRFTLAFPNFLLFSRFTSWILRKSSSDAGAELIVSPKSMRDIRKCIKNMKKVHENWYIVDVCDGDTSVKIKM